MISTHRARQGERSEGGVLLLCCVVMQKAYFYHRRCVATLAWLLCRSDESVNLWRIDQCWIGRSRVIISYAWYWSVVSVHTDGSTINDNRKGVGCRECTIRLGTSASWDTPADGHPISAAPHKTRMGVIPGLPRFPDLRPSTMTIDLNGPKPNPRVIVLCFDGTGNQFDETVGHLVDLPMWRPC